MNIKEAKQEIKNSMTAYFSKDKFGHYLIPIEKQRPVFLMGPPGIGKTAIMEQVAGELDVALVSYSMTHHTRQSALGLPFIEKKTYGGKEYSISEYTMSEIIASVYDMIESTGKQEGILFLDEINCVSETLAPAMLQFLQYKIFGRHRVPDGWIVVTAGNPPEYNNSVREFDIVTWDRLKRIDITQDYDAWREYALNKGTHPSITTYLDIKKDHFYKIESTVDGKSFVTARGWSDLSDMIKLYEMHGLEVNIKLVSQYVQNKNIAREFATYYDLFNKYRSDYQVDKILAGKADEVIKHRAQSASYDEHIALMGLIIDAVVEQLHTFYQSEFILNDAVTILRKVKKNIDDSNGIFLLKSEIAAKENMIESGKKSSSLSRDKEYMYNCVIELLNDEVRILREEKPESAVAAFKLIKSDYDKRVNILKKNINSCKKMLSNTFDFCESVFGEESQEILIFVTEMTVNDYCAYFVSRHGCEEYFKHNKSLLFYERQIDILRQLDELKID